MDRSKLEKSCKALYGKQGKKLYKAMIKLNDLDFCVSTAWDNHSVSIAKSCEKLGRVFNLSKDYQHIVLPDRGLKSINSLTYNDIAPYLPNSRHPYEGDSSIVHMIDNKNSNKNIN